MKRKKRKQKIIETYDHVDLECIKVYDDVFGTERGCYFLEPNGMLAYDSDTDKYYFCGMEERNTFLDRCQCSMECGRNLFAEEWREWEGYEEGCLY